MKAASFQSRVTFFAFAANSNATFYDFNEYGDNVVSISVSHSRIGNIPLLHSNLLSFTSLFSMVLQSLQLPGVLTAFIRLQHSSKLCQNNMLDLFAKLKVSAANTSKSWIG